MRKLSSIYIPGILGEGCYTSAGSGEYTDDIYGWLAQIWIQIESGYIILCTLELSRMRWGGGVRLQLPRNVYGWGAWMWGPDDVRMERWGSAQEVGFEPPGTPSNSSTGRRAAYLLTTMTKMMMMMTTKRWHRWQMIMRMTGSIIYVDFMRAYLTDLARIENLASTGEKSSILSWHILARTWRAYLSGENVEWRELHGENIHLSGENLASLVRPDFIYIIMYYGFNILY